MTRFAIREDRPRGRRARNSLSGGRAATLLALTVIIVSGAAPAAEIPVFLGAVGVGKAKPAVRAELRSLINAELSKTDFAQVTTRERFVLSATLLRLDSVLAADSVRATCVVSVALLREKGTTLHAVIRGRATAEEAREQVEAAQSDALRAAVHSAITRVPQALLH